MLKFSDKESHYLPQAPPLMLQALTPKPKYPCDKPLPNHGMST